MGLQDVAVMVPVPAWAVALLPPGSVMGPETAQMARMKLAVVSEEGRGSALF